MQAPIELSPSEQAAADRFFIRGIKMAFVKSADDMKYNFDKKKKGKDGDEEKEKGEKDKGKEKSKDEKSKDDKEKKDEKEKDEKKASWRGELTQIFAQAKGQAA